MKVLQINSTVGFGSTGRIVEEIGEYVLYKQSESFIAYGRKGKSKHSSVIKIGSKFEQFNHLIKTRIFDTHGFHSSRATKKLINQIIQIKPDVIHLHNLHGYYLNVKIIFDFLKTKNIPIVWTLHDCWPFTGHCCHYERVSCRKWKTECNKCPLTFLYPESIGYDNSRFNFLKKKECFTGIRNLTIITVSKWLETQVNESFLKDYKVKTVYNGIDLSIFKPTNQVEAKGKLGLNGFTILLGVANVWSEGKGLAVFIELAKLIDPDYRIILIGLDAKQIKSLPQNIIGFERTKSLEDLVEYYNAADVFISPSIAESFGLVVAEALSCGTPVIVNDSSALSELTNDEVGKVCFTNSPIEYLQLIKRILYIGKEYYSSACRKKAEDYFDKHKQLEKYYQLYNQIVE
jgi:putative colanic acid biosynthesis glycosyltransferase